MDINALPDPSDFDYTLSDAQIAFEPLSQRDASRMLLYRKGVINHHVFRDLPKLLPSGSRLFINETKVVMARLHAVVPETKRVVEIFCLEAPFGKSVEQVMQSVYSARFQCLVGGSRHWKCDSLQIPLELDGQDFALIMRIMGRNEAAFIIDFSWDAPFAFADILDAAGNVPLPPYILRDVEESDVERYQTIYAKQQGSVAAPTAGLHFTPEVMRALADCRITTHALVLHIGGGTFLPIKTDTLKEHVMHTEEMIISAETIRGFLGNATARIAVGTTSMRYMESVYWLGVRLLNGNDPTVLGQWDAFSLPQNVPLEDALNALLKYVERRVVYARTALMIVPGYRFRVVDALLTNFHQPKSTLLMLIAAAIGDDWRRVYEEALANDYRFLSYGDSNLYWITEK